MSAAMSSAMKIGAQRPVDVGRPAVALQVRHDDLVVVRERRQERAEHLARAEAAVQQDQRPTGAVDLVVEVDPVDVGVARRRPWSRSSSRWSSSWVLRVRYISIGDMSWK